MKNNYTNDLIIDIIKAALIAIIGFILIKGILSAA